MSTQKSKKMKAIFILFFLFVVYIVIAFTIMRFKHPEYSETELLLSFVKAILLDFK